jgi:hypothetical protein
VLPLELVPLLELVDGGGTALVLGMLYLFVERGVNLLCFYVNKRRTEDLNNITVTSVS